MKQKIVIKVCMNCDRARSKAMKVAAETCGVRSMAIEGNDLDQLVVTGEGIDSACLTRTLRKKVGRAMILKVDEVKPSDKNKNPPKCGCPPPPPPRKDPPKCGCPPPPPPRKDPPKCGCPPPPKDPPKCRCPPPPEDPPKCRNPPPPPPPPPYPCAPYPYYGVVCEQEPSYCSIT